ncbi:N-acetyltransferase [Thalassotalea euphylliae]|uniref:N-acetyltransferase n=1 Tax=Thalassotalea euphylliae TaxID=1655234 RepID=A0A3E0TKQ6_9GAMM|nr:GNAT family N-acetyltransferase [Thalassotalea euphylliae]REL25151.1 N-acetyltransferase [Thalassotalea euphylliae]
MDGYRISCQLNEMSFEVIHDFISSSYWAAGMPADTLHKALANSLCFAVLNQQNNTVAFARVITDKATFAYLADVFVVAGERGEGLSKYLVEYIVNHDDLQGLRRFMLATFDAHSLYEKFGFSAVDATESQSLMQIRDADVYLRDS